MSSGNKIAESAQFVERASCINCGSGSLTQLSTGLFDDKPLFDFLSADPWGENPIPFLLGNRWSFVQCNDCNQAFHRYILAPDWNERRFSKWMTQEAIEAFERRINTPDRVYLSTKTANSHELPLRDYGFV